MAWRTLIDPDDLLTVLAGPELSAYRAAAQAAGQADPVAESITNCVNMIRGYVAGWVANTLGPEGTIPDKLIQTALDILAVTIPRRCAGKDPTDARKEAYDEAMKLLRDVSKGTFKLEMPTTFTTEQIAIVKPSISPRHVRPIQQMDGGI